MDCAIKVLEMKDLQNCMMKRQRGEFAGVLRRWYLIPSIDPKMKGKYRISDWIFNQVITVKELFDIPTTEQYIYLELLFICDRRNELMDYMQENVLNDLALEAFAVLENSDRSDLTEQMMKAIINIREIYLDIVYRYKNLIDEATYRECVTLRNQIELFINTFVCFPRAIRESISVKSMMNTLETIESSFVKRAKENGDDVIGMKKRFTEAEFCCKKNEELKYYLHQAFEDGMIDSRTFKSLNFNVIESKYAVFKYDSRVNENVAKTSHFIYKLKTFKNYPFILSEYADVLNRMELNVADIMKAFGSSSILLPHLLTMLNVLLKKEMENLEWERLLEDYSDYPFVTPVEVSQGDSEVAIEMLFEKDWYDSYWKSNESKVRDRSEACAELKRKLVRKCYSNIQPREIVLRVPLILDAIDNLKGINQYSYFEVSQVDVWWKCDIPSRVKPGTLIPSEILKMERSLLHPSSKLEKGNVLLGTMWTPDCPMRIEEKLKILCPRKRTTLGNVVLDMRHVDILRNSLEKVIIEVQDIDDLVSKVIATAQAECKVELNKLHKEWKEAEDTVKASDAEHQKMYNELVSKKQALIQKYTRIANERTIKTRNDEHFERRNKNTIGMFTYMHAVNNLKKDDFLRYINTPKNANHKVTYEVSKDYHPFDFQMILIPHNHEAINKNQRISISLYAPEGINSCLQSNTIKLCGSTIPDYYGVSVQDGYLLVLPLAPFKWKVEIHIGGRSMQWENDRIEMVYYTNKIGQLDYYSKWWNRRNNWDMYNLLCFLRCMVIIRDTFSLRYVVPIGEDKLYLYNYDDCIIGRYNSTCVYFSTHAPFSCSLYKYINPPSFSSYSTSNEKYDHQYCIVCTEVISGFDLLPCDQLSFDSSKKQWTVKDYLGIGPDLGSVVSIDKLSIIDVSKYQRDYQKYLAIERKNSEITNEIRRMSDKYKKKQQEYDSIMYYFFPKTVQTKSQLAISSTLNDVIVVLYNGKTASIGLPKDKTYFLPTSYVGKDGNQITIPYIKTSNEVKLVVTGTDCDVSSNSNSFIFVMKDNEVGKKKVKLTANVYRISDNEKLDCEEFYLSYERKQMPDHIVTSVDCCIYDKYGHSKSVFYLTPLTFPCSVDVYIDNVKKTIQCRQGYWTDIVSKPSIKMTYWSSFMTENNYSKYSRCFIWNISGLSVFNRDFSPKNTVAIPHVHSTDPPTAIANLKSKYITQFVSAFSDLLLVILSANDNEKQEILSILNGCSNDLILPSIREAAESVFNAIFSGKSSLQWNSVINTLNSEGNDLNYEMKENEKSVTVNYSFYFERVNKMKMDEIFQMVYKRRTTNKYVKPSSFKDSLTKEILGNTRNEIDMGVVQAVISTSVNVIESLKQSNCMNRKPHSTVNIIIDTNCSLRKNKLRMRTITSCILVTVMRELGISFNLYVFCGRYKGVYISMEDRSIREIISFLFDMKEVVKMPSTPLDLLTVKGQFNEKDPVVIVSDGFSEQLMSKDDEVRNVFRAYSKLFLLCVKGKDNEALSESNQSLLEISLEANFHSNMIIVEKISDFYSASNKSLGNLFFDSEKAKLNRVMKVVSSLNYARDLQDNLKADFTENKSLVSINTITSTKPVQLVELLEENLMEYPQPISDSVVLKKLNGLIQGENLFDALDESLFVPNELSMSGNHGYPKMKKNSKRLTHCYNASVVIDCSCVAFSETNRIHSLITIFSVLRNLSNMQLPCIDLWVASSQILRVATGISSMDLWESNIVAALYQSLLSPCQNTCLPDCIRYACCTCNARSFQSIMMVLTNGVLCDDSRAEIKSIVSGIEITYLGIGIGLYLCGFEDLFPTMIWNSNPNHLSETIRNLSRASMKGTQNAVPEKIIDEAILYEHIPSAYPLLIEKINSIDSIYEVNDGKK